MKAPAETVNGVHLWLLLMKSFHAIEAYASMDLRSSELGPSDFRVLEALLHKGPLPVNTIGPKVFLTPGSISVAVDRLYERGLVSRIDSQADRRVRVVDLTRTGRKMIERVFRRHAERLENLAKVLTDEERTQLASALRKLGKQAASDRA